MTGADVKGSSIPRWKRILDVTLVLLAIPFIMPIGFLIFIFIKTVSPGPAFFRQQRVGYLRRLFTCLKFRTMKINADSGAHRAHLARLMTANLPTQKLDCGGDDRLIPGGKWLRVTGVDELPQLFNVLRGDLSLVGPRPCTAYEFEMYSERHKKRCEVPPGMTGLWQVSGKNGTTFEQMMDLDLKYAREMSFWLDVKIIARTIPAIMKLVWEMKIRPRLGAGTVERAAHPVKQFPAKAVGPPHETIHVME